MNNEDIDGTLQRLYSDPVARDVLARAERYLENRTDVEAANELREQIVSMRHLLRNVAHECVTECDALTEIEATLLSARGCSKRDLISLEQQLIALVEGNVNVKAAYNVATMSPVLSALRARRERLRSESIHRGLTTNEQTELSVNESFCNDEEPLVEENLARLRLKPQGRLNGTGPIDLTGK